MSTDDDGVMSVEHSITNEPPTQKLTRDSRLCRYKFYLLDDLHENSAQLLAGDALHLVISLQVFGTVAGSLNPAPPISGTFTADVLKFLEDKPDSFTIIVKEGSPIRVPKVQ